MCSSSANDANAFKHVFGNFFRNHWFFFSGNVSRSLRVLFLIPQVVLVSDILRPRIFLIKWCTRVWAQDRDRVRDVRGVPAQNLMRALERAKEPGGALQVAMHGAAAGGPKGGQGGVQNAEPPIKSPRPDENLSINNKPFIADAFVLEGRGVIILKMGVPRVSQDQGALDGAKHVTLLSSPVGGKLGHREESGDRIRLVLPLGPSGGLLKVTATRRCRTC